MPLPQVRWPAGGLYEKLHFKHTTFKPHVKHTFFSLSIDEEMAKRNDSTQLD